MIFSENFLMAIRPNNLNVVAPDSTAVRATLWRTFFDCRCRHEVLFKATTEKDLWTQLVNLVPDALEQLARSQDLLDRALSERASLMLGSSDDDFSLREQAFGDRTKIFYEKVMKHLHARQATKTPPRLRRAGKSERAAFWEYRVLVTAPHLMGRQAIVVRVFPSPYSDTSWTLRVRMPANSEVETQANQAALRAAINELTQDGFTIEDVTSFTEIEL